MAFLGESFDHWSGYFSGNLPLLTVYSDARDNGGSGQPSLIAGRFGGQALRLNATATAAVQATTYMHRYLPSGNADEFAFEFACRRSTTAGMSLVPLFYLMLGATIQCRVGIAPNGALVVGNASFGAGLLGTTDKIGLVQGARWVTVGIEGQIGDAAPLRLKVDGRERLYLPAADTKALASAGIDGFAYVSSTSLFGGSVDTDFDDVYYRDVATLFGQPIKAEPLYPNSDVGPNQFTRNTGASDWSAIDDATPDGETTYLESNTVGHKSRHGLTDLSTVPAAIYAAQAMTVARKTDAGLREMRTNLVSAGTVANGVTQTLGVNYGLEFDSWEVDPDTAAAMNATGVNAFELELEVVT